MRTSGDADVARAGHVPGEPPRIGFIGCGRHATKMLYPCVKLAQMELAAVCDLDEVKARRNARWFGAERVYTHHERMLDAEALDAVLICTGPTTHAALARAALARGLPVFIEKPPALTLAEAEGLREASEAARTPVMVGLMKRHALVYQRLKALIRAPGFGPVGAVQARMAVGWKNGNGYALLLDMGIHFIDLVRHLAGDLTLVGRQRYTRESTHITYAALLRLGTGAVGTLVLSDQHHWTRANERIEVTGDGQFAIAENLVTLTHYRPDGSIAVWEPGMSIPSDENSSYFLSGYAGQLRAFADAVRGGGPVSPSIGDACAAMRLIEEIEPDEAYEKGPQQFEHWMAEDRWLQPEGQAES